MTAQKLTALVSPLKSTTPTPRWGIQGREHDLYVEGDTLNETLENFGLALVAEAHYCVRHSLPLNSLGQPPELPPVSPRAVYPAAAKDLTAAVAAAWPGELAPIGEIEFRHAA